MYSSILHSLESIGYEMGVRLLERFHLQDWLQASPSVQQKIELLQWNVFALKQCGQKVPEHGLAWFEVTRRFFLQLLQVDYPLLVTEAFDMLLQGIFEQTLPIDILADFACFLQNQLAIATPHGYGEEPYFASSVAACFPPFRPISDDLFTTMYPQKTFSENLLTTKHLLLSLCHRFHQQLFNWRTIHGSLYPVWNPYMEPLLSLYELLVMILLERFVNDSSQFQENWSLLQQLFDPWIDVLDASLIKGKKNSHLPWTSDESCKNSASLLGISYVNSLNRLIGLIGEETQILNRVWNRYTLRLSACPVHILSVAHDFLTSLPWEHFVVDSSILLSALELTKHSNDACLSFVSHILVRIDWKRTERDVIGGVYQGSVTEYYRNLLSLLLVCIQEPSCLALGTFVEFLASTAHFFQWRLLDVDSYTSVLRDHPLTGKAIFLFNHSSAVCQSSQLLRAALGFPPTENLSYQKETFTACCHKLHSYLRVVITLLARSSDMDQGTSAFA
eukprot:Sdes_comp20548_c0_seq2m15274